MLRADLQKISGLRIKEAKVLLDAKLFAGAFHLAGFAVECGLKACIAKKRAKYEFPDKKLANDAWTHNLSELVKLAGLQSDLDSQKKDAAFDSNWTQVKNWTPERRYELAVTKIDAEGIYRAITSRKGVMRWIRRHW